MNNDTALDLVFFEIVSKEMLKSLGLGSLPRARVAEAEQLLLACIDHELAQLKASAKHSDTQAIAILEEAKFNIRDWRESGGKPIRLINTVIRPLLATKAEEGSAVNMVARRWITVVQNLVSEPIARIIISKHFIQTTRPALRMSA